MRRPYTLSTTILLAPAPPITDWPPHSPIPYSNHGHVSASFSGRLERINIQDLSAFP